MALQPLHAALPCFAEELGVELIGGTAEDDVHVRTAVGMDRRAEERALVEEVIQQRRLLGIALRHRRQPARFLDPLQHLADHVDGKGRRRIVERPLLHVGPVLQHRRNRGRCGVGKIGADDRHDHTGGSEILLRTSVDHAVPGNIDRPTEHVARGVGDQRHPRRHSGQFPPLGAIDGIVGREVDIGRALGIGDRGNVGNPGEFARLARDRHVGRAELPCLLHRLLGPDAGMQVVGGPAGRQQVHRHHRELLRRAALHEDHLVLVRDPCQPPRRLLGLVDDLLEQLPTVAVFRHTHPAATDVPDVLLRLPQHRFREDTWPRAEIVDPFSHGRRSWSRWV